MRTSIFVEYQIDLPDNLDILGHECSADDSFDDGTVHYFCHPSDDLKDDIDIMVDNDGLINLYIGDGFISDWEIPNPNVRIGVARNSPEQMLRKAVGVAETIIKSRHQQN